MLFAAFQRPILVPWEAITVTRQPHFLGEKAILQFGGIWPELKVDAALVDALWRRLPEQWPEMGPPPERPPAATTWGRLILIWALGSAAVSTVFIAMTRLTESAHPPPIVPLIAFPAIVLGLNLLLWQFRRRHF